MAFIPVEDVASVSLRYTQSGQQTENVMYFLNEGAINPTNLAELAASLAVWWQDELRPLQTLQLTFREAYATDLTTEFSPTATATLVTDTTGTLTGTPLPNNVTIAVSFRTPGRGRSSRGRNYFCGLTEASLSSTLGQTINTSYAADLLAAYDALDAALSTGWSHVIVSRYLDGAPRSAGLAIPVTNYILTDLTVDSQRRRLPGRGT